MRRQSGYEQDWINAMNAAGNLANTLSTARTRGLQADITEQALEEKRRQQAIADHMTTGLTSGLSVDELSKTTSVPRAGKDWEKDFNKVNTGLEQGHKDFVSPEGFTRSSDRVGSAEVVAGLNDAIEQRSKLFKNTQDAEATKIHSDLAKLPVEQILNSPVVQSGDFSAYGDKAAAAAIAYQKYLSDYSKIPEVANKINKDRRELVNNMYVQHQSKMGLAAEYLKKGMNGDATDVLTDIINNSPLAYKAEKTPEGKIKLSIVTDGVPAESETVYEPAQLFNELLKYGQKEFAEQTYAAMEDKKRQNEKRQEYFVDKNGKVLTALPQFDIKSGDNKWMLFLDGKQVGRGDLSDFIEMGFTPIGTKKQQDDQAKSQLDIAGKKQDLQNKIQYGKNLKEKQTSAGGGTKGENLSMIKYNHTQAVDAMTKDAQAAGIPVMFNAETGDVQLASDKPLTQAQKDALAGIVNRYGYRASFSKVPGGVKNGWFTRNTDGYHLYGVTNYPPDGQTVPSGLTGQPQQQGQNSQAQPNLSRGEFDALITGEDGGGKAGAAGEKMPNGLWRSFVPADSALNYIADKTYDIAAGAGNIVKGGLSVLGAGADALSIAMEIKKIKNLLTYNPQDKDLLLRLKAAEKRLYEYEIQATGE